MKVIVKELRATVLSNIELRKFSLTSDERRCRLTGCKKSHDMRLSITASPSPAEFAPILIRGSLRQAFRIAHEAGCQGVELHLRRPEEVAAEEVVRLCREHALSVPTLGTGMAATQDGLTLSATDPDIRKKTIDTVCRYIDLAARIESAVTIGLIFGKVGPKAPSARERMSHAVSCLEQCAGYASRQNVTLFLEPLNRYESDSLNKLSDAAAVIERIGGDRIRILADTFHMNIEEPDITASLREYAGSLGHIHLADSNREAPGHGHTDLRSVLLTLQDASYKGFFSFESFHGLTGGRRWRMPSRAAA